MKKILAISFLVFCITASYAQPKPAILSIEGFGGESYDYIYPQVSKDIDGGFILSMGSLSTSGDINTGCMTMPSLGASVFRKYNKDGSAMEWEKCYFRDSVTSYTHCFPLPGGEKVFGGRGGTWQSASHISIAKEDAGGNLVWRKNYGGSNDDILYSMTPTTDGGYIMLAKTNSADGDVGMHYGGAFVFDIWAIKLDSDGNKLWSKVLGGSSEDIPAVVVPAPDGGCYITGLTQSWDHDCLDYHGAVDAFVARLDGNGNIKWTRCLGGSAADGQYVTAMASDKGGLIIANGSASDDGDVHNHIGDIDIWVVELDSNNNILWDNCYGTVTGYEYPYAICKSTDGTVWIGGFSGKAATNGNALVIEITSTGNLLKERLIGSTGYEQALMLHSLPDGLIFVGGEYDKPGQPGDEFPTTYHGKHDIFLVTLAPWTTGIDNTATERPCWSVYPIPATEEINIRLNSNKNTFLRVRDMTGRMVYNSILVGNETKLNVGNWPRGIYYLQIKNQNTAQTQKLLLQ